MNKLTKDTTYTWKDEYCLPYESDWSKIAKFSFLNGISWTSVYANFRLRKKILGEPSDQFFTKMPKFKAKKFYPYKNGYRTIDKFDVYQMCPVCMKHGYHSKLHEIEGFERCFLHKCKLSEINREQYYASQYGTYEFCDIKIENIVRNQSLAAEIAQFIQRKNEEKLTYSNYFFLDRRNKNESDRCYESTERLYQRLYLLQDDVELYGCKCLSLISTQEIDAVNKRYLERIMRHFVRNVQDKNFFHFMFKFNSFEEGVLYCCDTFQHSDARNKYVLREESLAWCLISIASEEIRKTFDDLEDWNDAIWYLTERKYEYPEEKRKAYKFAVILAFQAITGSVGPENVEQYMSKCWLKWSPAVSFNLPVYDKLSYIHQMGAFYYGSPTEASQYVVYPIIEDLFHELVSQANTMLEQGIITPEYECLHKLKPNIWKVPQYTVFYYPDRVEVYRCEPEYSE